MRIGLRTIKTVIAATCGILLASFLGLKFPSTAGIIAILSVTNTKTSSFKVGFGRIIALFISLVIAFICYNIIGYNPYAFGLYLLIYIPIAAKLDMSEAIPVNSVLITHFLNEQQMGKELVLNAISLLFIGVGLALIANSYMPNVENKIKQTKDAVDEEIKNLLKSMAEGLNGTKQVENCQLAMASIEKHLNQGESYAKKHLDNHLLVKDYYEMSYFQMRRMQLSVLEDMVRLLENMTVDREIAEAMQQLLIDIHVSYAEENDGIELKQRVEDVSKYYETKDLPKTRKEFENRAKLYQLLTEIQTFIDIKVKFIPLSK